MPLNVEDIRTHIDALKNAIETADPKISIREGPRSGRGRNTGSEVRASVSVAGASRNSNRPDFLVELDAPRTFDMARFGYQAIAITRALYAVDGIQSLEGAIAFTDQEGDLVLSWLIRNARG